MKNEILYKIYNWISKITGRINSWAWMRSVIILHDIRKKNEDKQ